MTDTLESMTVSRLAEHGGVSADTVRYYERIGLLPEADRDANGYRRYRAGDVERLRFIKHAQQFGLSLGDIRQLLDVRDGGLCPCGHADELLTARLAQLDEQIATLQQLRGDIAALLGRDVATSVCRSTLVPLSARPDDEEDDDGWM